MKKRYFWISGIIIIMFVALCITLIGGIFAKAEYSTEYTRIFGEFTAKTTSELLGDRKENTCYSPMSLFAALTLVAENSADDTRDEVLKTLGVNELNQLEETYNKMLRDIVVENDTADKSPTIILGNSLWIDDEYLTDESGEIIERNMVKLNCEIFQRENINADEVNGWISNKTNKLIEEVIEESNSAMALVNSLYYKALWRDELNSAGQQEFMLENGEMVRTSYIQSKEKIMKYKKCEDYTVAGVPLQAGELFLVLPQDGLELEKCIKERKMNDIISLISGEGMEQGYVNARFPKFQCTGEFEGDLQEMLKNIGIKALFDDGQWAISNKLNGKPTEIIQKNKLVVDEEGIEAASSTVVEVKKSKEDINVDLDITFDRPFLYILMKDGVPLFIGTVYNPVQ